MLGLGNPGEDFDRTRHNLGADVVAVVAERLGARLKRGRERARVGEARVDGHLVVLAVPDTFMNLSGEAAGRLVRRYGLEEDPARVVVVHDEMDLPTGRVKVKVGGGVAGHNGLASVRSHLHSAGFVRVRVGISRPPGTMDSAAYVLRRPSKTERGELDVAVQEAADAVVAIATDGVEVAMNRFNVRDAPPGTP